MKLLNSDALRRPLGFRRPSAPTLGPIESVNEFRPRRPGPRTLLSLTGAAAVLALALIPLTLRGPVDGPGPSLGEPPSMLGAEAALEPSRDVRFDLQANDPTFRVMADRLPALEGRPSGEDSAVLEPVVLYASLAPEPPDLSTESVPLPPTDEPASEPVAARAEIPPAVEDRPPAEVATTGSTPTGDLLQPQAQVIDRPPTEKSRSRPSRAQVASTEPRVVPRAVLDPRPRSPVKPPAASRASGDPARPARQAAAATPRAASPPANNKPWTLPTSLQPTQP